MKLISITLCGDLSPDLSILGQQREFFINFMHLEFKNFNSKFISMFETPLTFIDSRVHLMNNIKKIFSNIRQQSD